MNVVCSIIVQKGKVLIAQRPAEKSSGGRWEFPGGKQESGEDSPSALIRELKEELNIDLSSDDLHGLGSVNDDRICLSVFVQELHGFYLPLEHGAIAWVSLQNLHSYDLCPLDREAILTFEPRVSSLIARFCGQENSE